MPKILDLVTPFWDSSTIHGETLLFVRSDGARAPEASLAFKPEKILHVSNACGDQVFEHGHDYHWDGHSRTLQTTPESRIRILSDSELYPPRGSQKYGTCRTREADILFSENTDYHDMQVAVTYVPDLADWQTPATLHNAGSLPNTMRLLAARRPLSVVLLGDSISVGMNASALYGVPPHQPGYGPLVAQAMDEYYGSQINFTNLSVGGMTSEWGCGQTAAAIAAKPDLMLLAFGMNDASGKYPPERFAGYIHTMMENTRKECPKTEFLLIAGMTGNPEWTCTETDLYPLYRDALWQMRTEGVAVAEVMSVWLQIVGRKKFYDLTGNGLNHPNDFGHRLYAQVIWSLLCRKSSAVSNMSNGGRNA